MRPPKGIPCQSTTDGSVTARSGLPPSAGPGAEGGVGRAVPPSPGDGPRLAVSSVVCVFPPLGRTRGRLDEGHPSDHIYLHYLLKHLSPNTATLRGVDFNMQTLGEWGHMQFSPEQDQIRWALS